MTSDSLLGTRLVRLVLLAFLAFAVPGAAVAQKWSAFGIVIPLHDVTMSVSATGTVSRLLKKEGDPVKAGEAIVQLENDLETLDVQRRRLVWADNAELRAAQQRLSALTDQLSHTRELYKSTHSVSEDKLKQEELQVALAQLEVQRLTVAEQQEEVDYRMAEARLKRRTIAAPFDGVVVKLSVDVGDVCNPGQPVLRVVDLSKCHLVVHMSAAESNALHNGMPVRVVVNGYGPNRSFNAVIDYVSPVVDPSSSLREIKAIFDNPSELTLAGLTGTLLPK